MARMLGKSYAVWARIKLPNGGAVAGVRIGRRVSRRAARARESAGLHRTLSKIENDRV